MQEYGHQLVQARRQLCAHYHRPSARIPNGCEVLASDYYIDKHFISDVESDLQFHIIPAFLLSFRESYMSPQCQNIVFTQIYQETHATSSANYTQHITRLKYSGTYFEKDGRNDSYPFVLDNCIVHNSPHLRFLGLYRALTRNYCGSRNVHRHLKSKAQAIHIYNIKVYPVFIIIEHCAFDVLHRGLV